MTERFAGEGAQAYDERIPLLVPGYELLHQLSAAQLMTRLGQSARVLLVGVGPGHLGRHAGAGASAGRRGGDGIADQLAAGRLTHCLAAM
ncbi:hypothetical protein D3C79_608800 [compost metagenome]